MAVHALERARHALAAAETRTGVLPAGEHVELGALSSLFREGWPPGRVLAVHGATSAILTAAASAMGSHGWLAAVGMRNMGWAAAAAAGIDLQRVVILKAATADAVALCVDSFDVVVLGNIHLDAGQRRSLEGRIRTRRTTVISRAPWPGAAEIHAIVASPEGCGRGDGHMRGWRVRADRIDRPAHAMLRCTGLVEAEQEPITHLRVVS